MKKLAKDVRMRRIAAISLIVWLALLFNSLNCGEEKAERPAKKEARQAKEEKAEIIRYPEAGSLNLVKEVRFEDLADKTRVVITTEQPAQYRFFRLLEPERIEVKVLDADYPLKQEVIKVNKGSIDRIKLERAQTDAERIVRVLIYCRKFTSYHLFREGNKIIVEIVKPSVEESAALELKETELKRSRETQAKKYYDQGKRYYKKGDYSGAITSFKKALEINPDYSEAQGYLAKNEAKLLSLEKKEELLRLKEQWANREQVEEGARPKEQQKRSCEHFKLGQAYYKKKMFQEAIKEFESALAEDPGSKKARNLVFRCKKRLIKLEQEWIKAEQRKKQKQIKRLAKEKAREEKEKKKTIIRCWRSGKKYWQKGDFLKASEEWANLLSIDPTFERIDRYILPEELERAAKSRQMSEEELESFHQLAQIRGLYWQAKDKVRQEQEKIRKQINRHYQLGVEYYKNGYWQDAVSEFQKLLKLDSKHAKAQKLFLESRIKSLEDEKKKRFVEIGAEEKIREGTQREAKEEKRPQTKEMQDELKEHYRLGKRYYRQEAFKKAASEFEQVLKIDPTYSPASRMLAVSEKEIAFKDTERRIQLARKEYARAMKDISKESPWGKTKLALGLSGSVTLKSRHINSTGAKDKKESTLDRNIDLNFRKTLARKNHFLLNLGTQESDNDNRDTMVKKVKLNYRRDRLLTLDTVYRQSESNWLNPYNKSLTYTDSHIDLRTNIPNIPKLHVRFQERKRGDNLESPDTKNTTQTYQVDATHKIGPTQFWVNRLVRKFDDELDKVDDTEEEASSAKVKIILSKFLSFFQEYKKRKIEKENNSDWGYETDTWSSNLDLKPLKNLTIKAKFIDKTEYNKETKVDTDWITRGVQVISRLFGQKLFLNFGWHEQEKDIDVRTATDKDSRKTTYICDVRLRPWKDLLSLSCNYQNEKEKYTDPSQVKMDADRLRSGLSFKPVKFLTLSTWYTISDRKYKYQDSEVLTTSFYYQGQFTGLRGRLTLNSGFRTEDVNSTNPTSEVLNNNKSVNANVRYNLTPRLNLNMNGRYTWFEGSTDYDKTAISSSIGWRIFDDTRIKLGYSLVDFDSHASERDYTTNMFDLSLTTRF